MLPEALAAEGWPVEKHDDHFSYTTSDAELLREVAARGWVFITQDKRIRFRAAERQALLAHGLRSFSIASTANLSAAETVEVLKKASGAIDKSLVAEGEGPFLYGIYKDGSVRRLNVEPAESEAEDDEQPSLE